MKKKILTLLILSLALTGCIKNVDKQITDEQAKNYESAITEAKDAIKNNPELTDKEVIKNLEQIAVSYDRMGNYKKAIPSYEEIIAKMPTNFLALNNLVAIYEESGDLTKALTYMETLYQNYKDQKDLNTKVVKDSIRLLVETDQFDKAQQVLEEFTRNYKSDENISVISDQFDYIQRVKKSRESKK